MNYIDLKNELVQWIKDWFEENGPGCNAVRPIFCNEKMVVDDDLNTIY